MPESVVPLETTTHLTIMVNAGRTIETPSTIPTGIDTVVLAYPAGDA